jgi:hypothetical protein
MAEGFEVADATEEFGEFWAMRLPELGGWV